MSFINVISDAIFGNKSKELNARDSAKQRLHLVLINDRAGETSPEYLPKLRYEILEVIKKYVPVANEDDVEINFAHKDDTAIMEMSISLEKQVKTDK